MKKENLLKLCDFVSQGCCCCCCCCCCTNKYFNLRDWITLICIVVSISCLNATTYYLTTDGSPTLTLNWNTNLDDSGTRPSNFTTDGDIFIIPVGKTATLTEAWPLGARSGRIGSAVQVEVKGSLFLSNSTIALSGKKTNCSDIKVYSAGVISFGADATITAADSDCKFTLNSGATLKTQKPDGIYGSIKNILNLTVSLAGDANYELNGTAAQVETYPSLKATNFTVNNSAGVTLNCSPTVESLTINPASKLTLSASQTLTVARFNILSDLANGSGTYVDNGTTIISEGATVQNYLTSGRNWYISSPVVGATSSVFDASASLPMYCYNESANTWPIIENASTKLDVMTGYVSRVGVDKAITFAGTDLNTGDQSLALARTSSVLKEGFHLVGNPYPSCLDWSKVVNLGLSTNINSTIWYRTKTSTGLYTFDTYNGTSGECVSTGAMGVTNLIPSMQAFWVRVEAGCTSGEIKLNNGMRAHAPGAGNLMKAKSVEGSSQQILRLYVSNGINGDEAVVYFNENALNGFDSYDSEKMSNDNPKIPEIYTVVDNEKLVINGMNSVPLNVEIPLGFTTGESNSFSINVREFLNFDSDIKVVLLDKLINFEQEISNGNSYDFTSDKMSDVTRFSIIFKTSGFTTEVNNNVDKTDVSIFKNENRQLVFNIGNEANRQGAISIFDAYGVNVENILLTGSAMVKSSSLIAGVYVVSINVNGVSTNRKIIIN